MIEKHASQNNFRFNRVPGQKTEWTLVLASFGQDRPGAPMFSPNGPFPASFVQNMAFGQKCPRPKVRLFLGNRYPFHGTLLGASPRADIRTSLHRMGLRTSL